MFETLKVKRKTLAAEAKIIRLEEKKAKARKKRELNAILHTHRTHDVRKEARASHLAYGFLKGTPYLSIEQKCYEPPIQESIVRIIRTFGNLNIHPDGIRKMIRDWIFEGKQIDLQTAVKML